VTTCAHAKTTKYDSGVFLCKSERHCGLKIPIAINPLYFLIYTFPFMNSLKKTFAGVSAVAIMMSQVATVFAAYSDVPAGVWYDDAVKSFVDAGYLDAAQARFRGQDNANRAEFVKLVVELNGGVLSTAPSTPSFDDVATGAWYYKYFEEAGKEGWVRGDGSCYGKHPCYSRPSANINRAEAAAIIVRAFGLESTGSAPQFVDNPSGKWYTADIQTAADHCVLQGDDSTGRVRAGGRAMRPDGRTRRIRAAPCADRRRALARADHRGQSVAGAGARPPSG